MNMFLRMIICVSCSTLIGVTLKLLGCPDLINGATISFVVITLDDVLIEYARQRKEFHKGISNPDTIDGWESRSNDSD